MYFYWGDFNTCVLSFLFWALCSHPGLSRGWVTSTNCLLLCLQTSGQCFHTEMPCSAPGQGRLWTTLQGVLRAKKMTRFWRELLGELCFICSRWSSSAFIRPYRPKELEEWSVPAWGLPAGWTHPWHSLWSPSGSPGWCSGCRCILEQPLCTAGPTCSEKNS